MLQRLIFHCQQVFRQRDYSNIGKELHCAALNKANWSCTACGMYSGRRSSVERHIKNPKIHNGNATAILFTEYLLGRREGIYPPANRPSFGQKSKTFEEKVDEKIEDLFATRIAESSVLPSDDKIYLPHVIEAITRSRIREGATDWKGFIEILQARPNWNTTQGTVSTMEWQSAPVNNEYDLAKHKKWLEEAMSRY